MYFQPGNIKVDIPHELLPDEARKDDWFQVTFEPDPEEKETRKERIQSKLEKLKKRTARKKDNQ